MHKNTNHLTSAWISAASDPSVNIVIAQSAGTMTRQSVPANETVGSCYQKDQIQDLRRQPSGGLQVRSGHHPSEMSSLLYNAWQAGVSSQSLVKCQDRLLHHVKIESISNRRSVRLVIHCLVMLIPSGVMSLSVRSSGMKQCQNFDQMHISKSGNTTQHRRMATGCL